MSEQKPKKDLRARLGRTISPQTPGAAPIAPPSGVAAPQVIAPPASQAAASQAAAQPASRAAAPVAAPVIAPSAAPAKLPFGSDIAPPPFAKPAEPPKPERKRTADPFAAAASMPVQQEVRIAVDAKPVDDAEVGKSGAGRTVILVGFISIAAGFALGAGVGATNNRNVLYNTSVRDGHTVYNAVDTASRGVLAAQQAIEAIATSAGGGPSGHPSVNHDEIDRLASMPNPLPASAFAGTYYTGFSTGTVDDLFLYYNNIQELWRQFAHLRAIASGRAEALSADAFAAAAICPHTVEGDSAATRAAIDAAADATTTAASAEYVGVLRTAADGTPVAALRFASPELNAQGQPTGHIVVHMTAGDASTQTVDLWTPETAISSTESHGFVINSGNSAGVLAERLGSFRTFVQALTETRQLMTTTIEVQGRLTTSLGDIARLSEEFALPL